MKIEWIFCVLLCVFIRWQAVSSYWRMIKYWKGKEDTLDGSTWTANCIWFYGPESPLASAGRNALVSFRLFSSSYPYCRTSEEGGKYPVPGVLGSRWALHWFSGIGERDHSRGCQSVWNAQVSAVRICPQVAHDIAWRQTDKLIVEQCATEVHRSG